MSDFADNLAAALRKCESEQIHIPGSIQPCGALLVVDATDEVVVQVSDNLAEYLGLSPGAALGKPLADIINADNAEKIRRLPMRGDLQPSVPAVIHFQRAGRPLALAVQVHKVADNWVIEVEPSDESEMQYFGHLFIATRNALWESDQQNDILHYAQFIAERIRDLTGFDRVMLYRFDTHWNGEVIAESRNHLLPSLLGNHFPASDIPPQARQLYERNLIRVLVDVDAPSIPIHPILHPRSGQALDMSLAVLRSMSPIHIEYLRNMGVKATITVSLMKGGKLWGLIACHHASPKRVPFHLRELAEFVGKTVSLKLTNLESEERNAYMNQVRQTLTMLTRCLRQSGNVGEVLSLLETDILKLVRATGGYIAIGGKSYSFGMVPPAPEIDLLVSWLEGQSSGEVFHTDSLVSQYPQAHGYSDVASGLLAVRLDRQFSHYILWFREEQIRSIPWAGDPNKSLVVDATGPRIEPRRSFARWMLEQRGYSLPWSVIETDAAHTLSMTLIEVLTQKALNLSEQNYRLLAENSTDMIVRLDRHGIISFVSPSSTEVIGYPPGELVGNSCLQFVAQPDRRDLRRAMISIIRNGISRTLLFRLNCRDGKQIWLESTIKPVANQNGRPFEVVANSRDVTLRHEYQLAIESLQRRNDSILNAAGEGVIGIDHQGIITFANHTAADILGYARPDMIGEHASSVLGLCDGQGHRSRKLFDNLTAAAESPNFRNGQEACFTTKGGECIPVDCIVTYLDSANPANGLVLVFRDVTERRLIEARLRQSNTVFEHAAEAIMVTDENGVISAVNQAFENITGYSQAEALGQTPALLRSGRHDADFYRRMWQEIRERQCWRGEIWNRRKNGEIFPQWGSIAAVLDSSGKIRSYVTVFSDITEAKKSEAKLKFLANHDPLTGLPNRLLLSEKLNHSLAKARETGQQLAIAFVDLDHFKIVNDTLGHLVGDLYLTAIADRIGHALRQEDTLARWGGDEFVIAIENAPDREQLAEMIHRLQNQLATPLRLEGHDVVPSASIGIAIFPDDGSDVEKLVQSADAAMYRAKETGRNRFEFYTGDLTASARRRFELAWEIRQALQEDQFVLFYQPQYSAINGDLIGLEALIRWQHPRRGLLSPGEFLPTAEELNLTGDIGEWVLKHACAQLKRWDGRLPESVLLAINIAPVQLNPDFAELALGMIEATGIRTSQLEFEITEGALERRDDILSVLSLFSSRGIRLSIDDFGTGYSSLARVRDLPVDYFKIDKCFIDGLPDNPKDAAIVRTIVALATSLGIGTVAEGVETVAQLRFLQDEGVSIIQGFYLGRPQPAADIDFLLAEIGVD